MAGLNGGLTNWTRHQMLGAVTGQATFTALPNGLYVNLLLTNPTTAGTSSGGVNGAVEWAATRKQINDEGTSDPQMVRQAGDNGGWEMALQGTITWSVSDTAAIADPSDIVGVGIFDDSTGGNLVAWAEMATARRMLPGDTWEFQSDKLRVNMYQDLTD